MKMKIHGKEASVKTTTDTQENMKLLYEARDVKLNAIGSADRRLSSLTFVYFEIIFFSF